VAALSEPGFGGLVHVLIGQRGTGKTQLAAEIARSRMGATGQRLIAWVDAGEEETAAACLALLAEAAGLPAEGLDVPGVAGLVRRWLEGDGQGCLVVFDDVTDIEAVRRVLPSGGQAEILITSVQGAAADLGQELVVGEFTEQEGLQFLSERTGLSDDDGARQLGRELGWLPLGLAQAAAVIAGHGLPYATYLRQLRSTGPVGGLAPQTGDPLPYRTAAAIALAAAAAAEADASGLTELILHLISLLSAAGVPRFTLYAALSVRPDQGSGPLGAWRRKRASRRGLSPAAADRFLEALAEWSLVAFSVDGSEISMHRLVMQVVRDRCLATGMLPETVALAGTLLDRQVRGLRRPRANPAAAHMLAGQIIALHEHSGPQLDPQSPTARAFLVLRAQAAELVGDLGDNLALRISLWLRLAADSEQVLGPDYPFTLNCRNNLATAYGSAGKMEEAITLYRAILADVERIFGPDHPNTRKCRDSLVAACSAEERASLRKFVYGDQEGPLRPDRPESRTPNDFEPASLHHLADRKRVLGPGNPNVLAFRHNLANDYQDEGRAEEAIPLHEAVLADAEQMLGAGDPGILILRNSLAAACQEAGRTEEAISLYEAVLADAERMLGPDHPDTLKCRSNLAAAYHAAGQTEEIIAMLAAVRADAERILGPHHPDVLTCRSNEAAAYHAAGQVEEAVVMLDGILADSERILGPGHPDTLKCRINMAIVCGSAGQQDEAIAMFQSTLADAKRILGPDHPVTWMARDSLEELSDTGGQPGGQP
jgi:tetratricopeptide (TPR) repeat protein